MLSGIGPGSLLVILLIVVLIFGTKKLRNTGGDLGTALKNFRKSMNDDDDADKPNEQVKKDDPSSRVIEGDVVDKGDKTPRT